MVHTEELLGETDSKARAFDEVTLESLLADPEVVAWRSAMDAAALLPKKRRN